MANPPRCPDRCQRGRLLASVEGPARLQDPAVKPDNPPLLASIDPLHEAHTCGVVGSSEVGIGVSSKDDGLLWG